MTATTGTPSTLQSTLLVARREVVVRLRSKAFLISTGILLLAVLASIVLGSVLSATAAAPGLAVQRSVSNALPELEGYDVTLVDDAAEAEQLVRDEEVEAAVVAGSGSGSDLPYTVVALDAEPGQVVQSLSDAPDVRILEPADQNAFIVYLVALAFGLVFFMSALTFGGIISQSVVEEKQTRIVEILMSTIPVRALLAGKVLGNSLLAFAQIAIIGLLAGIGLAVTGQIALLGAVGASILWFVVFFTIGFVLLAALYAAGSSLVSRQEDVASVTTPVTMLVMIPYFLVIFFNDNDLVLAIMSYVPFSAPVGMPMRVFLGTAQWWEPILSLVVLVASTAVVLAIGSRIYRNSLLRMGGRVKLKDAIAG